MKRADHLRGDARRGTAQDRLAMDMDQALVLLASLTMEVKLVAAMVRRPADGQRGLPALGDKGVRLAGEEPSPRVIAIPICGPVVLRLAPCHPWLRGNHKNVVDPHVLVEPRRLEIG